MRAAIFASACIVFTSAVAQAEDTSLQVIKKAITAHGGADNLKKTQLVRMKVSGLFYQDGKPAKFEIDYVAKLPDYERVTIKSIGDEKLTVFLYAKGQLHVTHDGRSLDLSDKEKKEKINNIRLGYLLALVPILDTKTCATKAVGEKRVGGCTAVGVRIQQKDEIDIDLYFSGTTGLRVKAEYESVANDGKSHKNEVLYSGHKEINGAIWPITSELYRDGKLLGKSTINEIKFDAIVDDSEFVSK